MIQMSKFRGISTRNATEEFLLMYVDDIVLLGDTVLELHKKINILYKFCDKSGVWK